MTIITKEDFKRYLEIQKSGETNMFDVDFVCLLSGLSGNQVSEIIKNYPKYKKQFAIKLKGGNKNGKD